MALAQAEYIKIFNQVEFEIGVHRVAPMPKDSNRSLLHRPVHYRKGTVPSDTLGGTKMTQLSTELPPKIKEFIDYE